MIVENFSIGKCFTRSREKRAEKKNSFCQKHAADLKKNSIPNPRIHPCNRPIAKRPTRAMKIKKEKKRKIQSKTVYTVALTKSRCNISRGLLR